MGRINSFKKELLYICLFAFCGILYMSYEDTKESMFLIISVYSLFKIINKEEYKVKKIERSKALILRLATFVVTYIIAIVFLFSNSYKMNLNIANNPVIKKEKAVLLVYQGENEKYSMRNELTNIKLNKSILERVNAPLILAKNKSQYRYIGKSSYKNNTLIFKKKLEENLASDKYKVYIGYLDSSSYIEESLVKIQNDGYKNVIVVPIFANKDKSYTILKNRIDEMKLFNLNMNIKYTESLSNSDKLVKSYMNKINKYIVKEKISYTGVILIGSAEGEVEEELMLRKKIKIFLQEFSELEEHKVKKTWFRSSSNNYIDAVKNILEYGVGKIIIVYTKPGVTNIENTEILRNITKKVTLPEEIDIKIIDGFVTDDELVEEIKSRIEVLDIKKWY